MASESEDEPRHWLHRLVPFAVLAIFGAALWVLHRELSHFHFADFRTYLAGLSAGEIAFASAATLAGYLALMSYDFFGLRYIGQALAIRRIALTAFVGYAFSMNIGQSALSGGAVRMRLYTAWGIGAADVARVIGFNMVIGTVGQMTAGGLLFLFAPVALPESLALPFHSIRPFGVLLLLIVAAFFYFVVTRKAPLRIRSWQIDLPPLRIALPAVVISVFDWALSGIVLYALMPEGHGLTLPHLLCTVLLAHFAGVLSMVPGGLGVFETVVIHLLPDSVPKAEALSALLAFRAVYYLVPFLFAIILLGGHEILFREGKVSKIVDRAGAWLSPMVPLLLALATFAAGVILLLSGATPGIEDRMRVLESWIPLPVVELSHFLGSVVGVALLILAGALHRRIDAAFAGVAILLILGITASLLKGLDYEEAAILALILVAVLPCRGRFHRRASLFSRRFAPGWWLGVALVLGTTTWIGFTAYERVHYHQSLWLHFGFKGDASRFLRASAGVAAALGGIALWQLLRPGVRTPPPIADAMQLEKVIPLVRAAPDTQACLALLGDKRFLFSESGRSFLMFGLRGRTWVSMGDPVGDPSEAEDLIWDFREQCDAAGARSVFYEVRAETAHLYAGLGLQLFKLGEDARVDLRDFHLEGGSRRNLRRTKSKIERDGARFEVIPASNFDAWRDRLRTISASWLSDKGAAEKGFSLGGFHEDYLRHFDFAVVYSGDKPVAFANIWKGGGKHELSLDLMRHEPDAPYGVMEYLFLELMLWGKAEGYQWFSLGMAPLAGLENHSLAPLWNRIGAQIFVHGENFYNFQGLRAYKEKFDPVWSPRYLACPGITSLPAVLLDTTALIGGGLAKAIGKKTDGKGKKSER
jgi:phosphatidylglycerol lysyltransferase